MLAKTPATVPLGTVGSDAFARLMSACVKPPCPSSTLTMTATIDTSMMMPCTVSLSAVAL